jgi:hypothetical protein
MKVQHFQKQNTLALPFPSCEVSGLAEKVMAYKVLFTLIVAEELRARHVEYAPVGNPFDCIFGAVSLSEQWKDFSSVLVHQLKPILGCLLVVSTVYFPILDEF